MIFKDKRRAAIWGGLLLGVGLGSLLRWLLGIFETAHPVVPGLVGPGYPNMALTAFVVLAFSSMSGVGLGLVASALTRHEDARQAGTATAAEPSGSVSSQKAKPTARTIVGFIHGN
jgi:hypothetical protein